VIDPDITDAFWQEFASTSRAQPGPQQQHPQQQQQRPSASSWQQQGQQHRQHNVAADEQGQQQREQPAGQGHYDASARVQELEAALRLSIQQLLALQQQLQSLHEQLRAQKERHRAEKDDPSATVRTSCRVVLT
jgi:hypothetical protein